MGRSMGPGYVIFFIEFSYQWHSIIKEVKPADILANDLVILPHFNGKIELYSYKIK